MQLLELFGQKIEIRDRTCADQRNCSRIEDAGRNVMKTKLTKVVDDSVTGVPAATVPNNQLGLLRQQVGYFTLTLVAPLSTHNSRYRHRQLLAGSVLSSTSPRDYSSRKQYASESIRQYVWSCELRRRNV